MDHFTYYERSFLDAFLLKRENTLNSRGVDPEILQWRVIGTFVAKIFSVGLATGHLKKSDHPSNRDLHVCKEGIDYENGNLLEAYHVARITENPNYFVEDPFEIPSNELECLAHIVEEAGHYEIQNTLWDYHLYLH